MADTIIKQILDKIGNRLTNITTANGYNFTVRKIERAKLTPFQGEDLPAVNYWISSVENQKNKYGLDDRTANLVIEAYSKNRDNPFIDLAEKLAADIVIALERDTTKPKVSDVASYNLGNLVLICELRSYEYGIGEGQIPYFFVLVEFAVKFTASDMFTLA